MVFFHALILTAVKNCKNWERIKTDLQQPWPRLMWKPMKTVLSFVPTNHIWDNKKNMAAPMLKKKNLVKTVFSKVLCPLTCQPQIPTPDLLVADSDARPVNPRSWYPTWQPQIGPISQSQIVIPDQTTPDNLALVWQPPEKSGGLGCSIRPCFVVPVTGCVVWLGQHCFGLCFVRLCLLRAQLAALWHCNDVNTPPSVAQRSLVWSVFTAPRWLISLYYYIYFILGKGELKLNIWESQGEIY